MPITDVWNIPYFTKKKLVTSEFLEEKIRCKTQLMLFLPDTYKIERLSRSFIFTLIKHVTPDLYEEIKTLAKEEIAFAKTKKYNEISLEVKNEFYEAIINEPNLEVYKTYNHKDHDINRKCTFIRTKNKGQLIEGLKKN